MDPHPLGRAPVPPAVTGETHAQFYQRQGLCPDCGESAHGRDVMDSDGYPTEEELLRVEKWPDVDAAAWLAYVKTLWHFPDWGWREEGDRVFASTGGWSGNEDVIAAMQKNFL